MRLLDTADSADFRAILAAAKAQAKPVAQAWARWEHDAGETITTIGPKTTVQLGLLTLPVGPADCPGVVQASARELGAPRACGSRLGVSPIRAGTADSSVVVARHRLAWGLADEVGASAHAMAAVDCIGGGRPRPVSDRRC